MIITTKRSRLRYLFDILLTALGWTTFFSLFAAGILNIFRGEMRGPDAPFLPQALRDSISTLMGYTVMMLLFAAILIIWFQYNEYFGKYGKYGRYRRQGVAAISEEQLRQSLGVARLQFDTAQTARVMVVYHNENGAILSVNAADTPIHTDSATSEKHPNSEANRRCSEH